MENAARRYRSSDQLDVVGISGGEYRGGGTGANYYREAWAGGGYRGGALRGDRKWGVEENVYESLEGDESVSPPEIAPVSGKLNLVSWSNYAIILLIIQMLCEC